MKFFIVKPSSISIRILGPNILRLLSSLVLCIEKRFGQQTKNVGDGVDTNAKVNLVLTLLAIVLAILKTDLV